MKSYIRKSVSVLLITAVLLLCTFSIAGAAPRVIHETVKREIITSGAILERITRFTDDGWLSINVLRVDLSNPNVKIDTISHADSIRKLTSTMDLAKSRGAVAAINGGFFNWTNESGLANPIGPIVESGNIISADSDYNRYSETMASFAISSMNQALFNYWRNKITLIAPTGNTIEVARYNKNKPNAEYQNPIILDRRWGEKSVGTDTPTGTPDTLEMVVVNGVVTEIREGKPAITIPENGYVVVTRLSSADFIRKNFQVGDEVSFEITTTPDWKEIQTSIPGGAMLLKDGKIPDKFTHIPEGSTSTRNPRTAIGSSKDGKQVFFVTVDGRLNSSIGMTMTELAQFMQEIGAYNAVNLDGGGSTTMVARSLGNTGLSMVNTPSDGSVRKVTSAVGVFSIAPPSKLDGLVIETSENNVFVNTSRQYSVKGYDRYFNPVTIDPSQVKWSVSGIEGSFEGNVFRPTSVGSGKIIATVGDVSAEIEVNSLSAPVQLSFDRSSLKLSPGETARLKVTGKNKNGYYATINPDDVKWAVNGNIGKFEKGTFTASGQGTGYIDGYIGNTHAYCAVSVASRTSTITDKFEAENGTFTSYPSSVTGSYAISKEEKHSGNTSGKLTYDFTKEVDVTRAAYMQFKNGGVTLAKNTTEIGIWIYNSHQNSNWLRAEIYDAKGNKQLVDFTRSMDWTGWKYVTASTANIAFPAKLTRIYLAQVNPVAEKGYIYMDDLTLVTSSYPETDMSKIPKNTVPVDEANKSVTYTPGSGAFRFSVFGQSSEPKNMLENLLAGRFVEKTNSRADLAAIVGSSKHAITGSIKKPIAASTNTGYKSYDKSDSRFIQLDMSKGGLRATDKSQWHWFLQQLNGFQGKNVFIFLANSPKSFGDSLEAGLFQDILTEYKQKTGKNIWVFYKSDENSCYMERGIKYLTTAGYNIPGLDPKNAAEQAKYIEVTVNGSTVTFEFKPLT